MVTTGACRKSPPGYLRTTNPYEYPTLPLNWGSQPPVKICIANCGQTVPDTTVVCYIWQLMETYHRPT